MSFKRRGQQLPGENFYVKVPHHWLRDWRLTGNAKAVLGYWLGHDESYEVTMVQTLAEFNEGERALYAAIELLMEIGYVVRYQDHQGGGRGKGFGQVRYDLGPAAFEQQYVRNWGTSDPQDTRPRRDGTSAPAKAIADVSAGPRASTFRGSTKRGPTKGRSKKNNPLEEQPLEDQNPHPAPLGAEVTAVTREGRTSAALPRGKRSSRTQPKQPPPAAEGLELLAQLPRPWRECEPWVRRRLAGDLGKALETYGAPVIAAAIRRYAPDPGAVGDGQPDPGETRPLVALRRVLTLLAIDVRCGTCPTCGDEHRGACGGEVPAASTDAGLLVLEPGVCLICEGQDAPSRPDLPLQSSVCDGCWPGVQADLLATAS
jgi:hypothetical protein